MQSIPVFLDTLKIADFKNAKGVSCDLCIVWIFFR